MSIYISINQNEQLKINLSNTNKSDTDKNILFFKELINAFKINNEQGLLKLLQINNKNTLTPSLRFFYDFAKSIICKIYQELNKNEFSSDLSIFQNNINISQKEIQFYKTRFPLIKGYEYITDNFIPNIHNNFVNLLFDKFAQKKE